MPDPARSAQDPAEGADDSPPPMKGSPVSAKAPQGKPGNATKDEAEAQAIREKYPRG